MGVGWISIALIMPRRAIRLAPSRAHTTARVARVGER